MSWIVAVGLLAIAAFAVGDGQDTSKSPVPDRYARIHAFLEFIRYPAPPKGPFEALSAPRWNIPRFMSYVSRTGIRFVDPNETGNHAESYDRVQDELTRRRGPAFETLAHLAYSYSLPYPQYSALKFEDLPTGVVVRLGEVWYELAFVTEHGELRLAECHFLEPVGEGE